MCFNQFVRKVVTPNSLVLVKNVSRRRIHTTRIVERKFGESYTYADFPIRRHANPLHILCAFAAISTGILSGGIISKSVAANLRKNGIYIPEDDDDDDDDQNGLSLPPSKYWGAQRTHLHPMTDPFNSSTQESTGLLPLPPGVIPIQKQNDTDMKVFLNATIELCNKLSEGIETPESLVCNFNQILEHNGHSPIKVPQSVIDSSKRLFLSKNTNNQNSSVIQRDTDYHNPKQSAPRFAFSMPETELSVFQRDTDYHDPIQSTSRSTLALPEDELSHFQRDTDYPNHMQSAPRFAFSMPESDLGTDYDNPINSTPRSTLPLHEAIVSSDSQRDTDCHNSKESAPRFAFSLPEAELPSSFTSPFTLMPSSYSSLNPRSLNYFSSSFVARTAGGKMKTSTLNSHTASSLVEESPYI